MKYIFRKGVWYDEYWNKRQPEWKIDFTKPLKINYVADLKIKNIQEYNLNAIKQTEEYNENLEKKMSEQNKQDLEQKTMEVLKYNELI